MAQARSWQVATSWGWLVSRLWVLPVTRQRSLQVTRQNCPMVDNVRTVPARHGPGAAAARRASATAVQGAPSLPAYRPGERVRSERRDDLTSSTRLKAHRQNGGREAAPPPRPEHRGLFAAN